MCHHQLQRGIGNTAQLWRSCGCEQPRWNSNAIPKWMRENFDCTGCAWQAVHSSVGRKLACTSMPLIIFLLCLFLCLDFFRRHLKDGTGVPNAHKAVKTQIHQHGWEKAKMAQPLTDVNKNVVAAGKAGEIEVQVSTFFLLWTEQKKQEKEKTGHDMGTPPPFQKKISRTHHVAQEQVFFIYLCRDAAVPPPLKVSSTWLPVHALLLCWCRNAWQHERKGALRKRVWLCYVCLTWTEDALLPSLV